MRPGLRGWVGILVLALGFVLVGACDDDDGPTGPGRVCGGLVGTDCPRGQVCEFPAGECQTADLQGICVARPDGACPAVFDPVCGCDGQTYGNDCERLRAGVQKDHDGVCA